MQDEEKTERKEYPFLKKWSINLHS